MTSQLEEYMNTSIVNTNTIEENDFHMLLDCLEELDRLKKTSASKRKIKRSKRTKSELRKFQSQPQMAQLHLDEAWSPNKTATGNTFDGNVADSPCVSSNVSFNDTFNSDQLQEIFAYFDQDVSTTDLLQSDDSLDELDKESNENGVNVAPIIVNCVEKKPPQIPTTKSMMIAAAATPAGISKKCQAKKSHSLEMAANKPNDILAIINQFNRVELNTAKSNDTVDTMKKDFKFVVKTDVNKRNVGTEMKKRACVDRVSTYSGASTVTMSDSENDEMNKPFDVIDSGSVKQKVAFFNDHSSSERGSSTSPSTYSDIFSEDDFVKDKFKQNRDYFEKFFRGQPSTQVKPCQAALAQTKPTNMAHSKNMPEQIDPYERLKAVQTYVQTKYFLERIQRLALTFSKLDENRMSTMNLKRLHQFLVLIRDCTFKGNAICENIGQEILTDVEKNVMSAEELLFSAMKMAHLQQVNCFFFALGLVSFVITLEHLKMSFYCLTICSPS